MNIQMIIVQSAWFIAAILFLLGLKRMASPKTARSGIQWAGIGMVLAVVATFLLPGLQNIALIIVAIIIGVGVNWMWGRKVAMTDMPQMVALFNGMGGGSAAAIGAVELLNASTGKVEHTQLSLILAALGALIGSVSLTGSIIAWAKLDGRMDKRFAFTGQQWFNAAIALITIAAGVMAFHTLQVPWIIGFFALALLLGILMTLPIGGADMPVVISLYNAFTGLAVAFEGFAQNNYLLIIAGMMVGAAGTLLTRLMAKAMNRSIGSVLFSNFGGGGAGSQEISGSLKPIDGEDAASLLYLADNVIIVPGYGMAVAQAQHKIWELSQMLIKNDKNVKFAIHPVAGRMPGHMNVLLAEAGVPYDLIADMDDVNPEFPKCDVAIVIGANDVVNPVAKTDKTSPIYGMPILDVADAKQVIVIKRGKGTGFAGIENALFYQDNTRMLYADGQDAANQLITGLKGLYGGGVH